jgi:hypothetical protein
MANAHGGLVLVGIIDADREIVGVKVETLAHVADTLTTQLDPGNSVTEDPATRIARGGSRDVDAPQIPAGPDGTADPAIDMVLKTSLIVTPGLACLDRSLSGTVVANLATALTRRAGAVVTARSCRAGSSSG